MKENRLLNHLDHMERAAFNASNFVKGMTPDDFLRDERTQQAVFMSILVIGETVAAIKKEHPDFISKHGDVDWQGMYLMRNHMAHKYFNIDTDLV
ncbi:MAG: DUF86 domain-containing protein [Defluviitaleaceae bacterium]|nr:DUF86 domain-containing protein [Defluviitaleaceae bacterium]